MVWLCYRRLTAGVTSSYTNVLSLPVAVYCFELQLQLLAL